LLPAIENYLGNTLMGILGNQKIKKLFYFWFVCDFNEDKKEESTKYKVI
tara:strand:+ start:2615 stop:2761 length:147 start_codon:yes stop_codon:yes gene_type:complete